jgi:hypothetical protein
MELSGAAIVTYRPQYRPLSAIRYLDANSLPTRYTLFSTLVVTPLAGRPDAYQSTPRTAAAARGRWLLCSPAWAARHLRASPWCRAVCVGVVCGTGTRSEQEFVGWIIG